MRAWGRTRLTLHISLNCGVGCKVCSYYKHSTHCARGAAAALERILCRAFSGVSQKMRLSDLSSEEIVP